MEDKGVASRISSIRCEMSSHICSVRQKSFCPQGSETFAPQTENPIPPSNITTSFPTVTSERGRASLMPPFCPLTESVMLCALRTEWTCSTARKEIPVRSDKVERGKKVPAFSISKRTLTAYRTWGENFICLSRKAQQPQGPQARRKALSSARARQLLAVEARLSEKKKGLPGL